MSMLSVSISLVLVDFGQMQINQNFLRYTQLFRGIFRACVGYPLAQLVWSACGWKGARNGGVVIWATNRLRTTFLRIFGITKIMESEHEIIYCTLPCLIFTMPHVKLPQKVWLKPAVMAFFLAGLARSRALHLARARYWGPTARCFSSALELNCWSPELKLQPLDWMHSTRHDTIA